MYLHLFYKNNIFIAFIKIVEFESIEYPKNVYDAVVK